MPISAQEAAKRLTQYQVAKPDRNFEYADDVKQILGITKGNWYGTELPIEVGREIKHVSLLTRGSTFNKIAGALKPVMEAGLKQILNLPYQHGEMRMPFRSSMVPDAKFVSTGRLVLACAQIVRLYDQPVEWLAEWCAYVEGNFLYHNIDLVLAVAIDSGNNAVFETLVKSMDGTHAIGAPSVSGIRALLRCKRPDAWPVVEKMLLHAERQEGLRQKIVECADELNPDTFKKVLKTLVEHNLFRFSSVIRSFLTWFPGLIDEKKLASAEKVVMRLIEFLDDPRMEPERTYADVYLRLWADAYFEATDAVKRAERLAEDSEIPIRAGAAALVTKLGLSSAYPLLARFLADDSCQVSHYVVQLVRQYHYACRDDFEKVFHEGVLFAARRWPKESKDGAGLERKQVWDAAFGISPASMLAFYCDNMAELSADGRWALARALEKTTDAKLARSMFIKFAGDGSSSVRNAAFGALAKAKLTDSEATEIESLLTRKSGDLRSSAITLLSNQAQQLVEASADRLLASDDKSQREAGTELAQHLAKKGINKHASCADQDVVSAEKLDSRYMFGLVDPAQITWAKLPQPVPSIDFLTKETVKLISDIDAYIHERRDQTVIPTNRFGNEEVLASELFCENIVPWRHLEETARTELSPFVAEVLDWLAKNEPEGPLSRKTVLRARMLCECCGYRSHSIYPDKLKYFQRKFDPVPRYISAIKGIVILLARSVGFDFDDLLDCLADEIAREADDKYGHEGKIRSHNEKSWRTRDRIRFLVNLVDEAVSQASNELSHDQLKRAFMLLRFIDEPMGKEAADEVNALEEKVAEEHVKDPYYFKKESAVYSKVPLRLQIDADTIDRIYKAGLCSESDVIYQIAGQLLNITKFGKKHCPQFREAVQKLVSRIVEVEALRGDMPGPASNYASDIKGYVHLREVLTILKTGVEFTRATGYAYGTQSRPKSFANLLKYSRPAPSETPEVSSAKFKEIKAKPDRLVELAILSPYWAGAVEIALGMKGLEDAAWWFHAHTKDTSYRTEEEKTIWFSSISERTPLSASQLENGACDPIWFHRFRSKLDDKQWKLLDKCAKFASDGTGHARAQLFAKALQGQLTMAEIADNIKSKRNPNYVRALGLLPLGSNPEQEVKERYAVLQEFQAGSKQFGSQKRETEKLAFEIAIDNLASTAGYPDALRLIWSLEAAEVEDMKDGITVTEGEVNVRLAFDDLGSPEITVEKAGKPLKEIPAPLKKLPAVKALTERRTQLKKQLVRMRAALEQAMQRGDTFNASELKGLLEHPGLKPLLQSLVFISESGLADFALAESLLLQESGWLRIAHPHDLLKRGDWPEWQRQVFLEERIQPFKQVFRELYVPTETEKAQDRVTRYGGHQVQPNRAIGILQKRGWIAQYEEGVTKTDHRLGITAHLVAEFNLYTPADIEGVTLDALFFSKAGGYDPIPLAEIPSVLFSETMRDLDLVVSVASSTGFDPEASESTVEMRQHVVEQTASLLRLDNVSFLERHVAITGKLAEYRVHMGSSVVHQLAKGELVIVAVRQPQRGRLFLPFVDDDPRTAELVSKVILLARDDEIRDPSILGQIIG